jgi:hypothetical protein
VTYFADLTPYRYLDVKGLSGRVSVGWLDAGHEFPTGVVPEHLTLKLLRLCRTPVRQTRGHHPCPLCGRPSVSVPVVVDNHTLWLGSAEIEVPAQSKVYAAPTLIAHYITAHGYRPPDEFLDAVDRLR